MPMAGLRLLVFSWVTPRFGLPGHAAGASSSILGRRFDVGFRGSPRSFSSLCPLGPFLPFRRRLIVNDLAGMIELLLDLCLGPGQSSLAEIDRISQEGASRLDAPGVAALLKTHAFAFEELPQIIIKLIFVDWSHKNDEKEFVAVVS